MRLIRLLNFKTFNKVKGHSCCCKAENFTSSLIIKFSSETEKIINCTIAVLHVHCIFKNCNLILTVKGSFLIHSYMGLATVNVLTMQFYYTLNSACLGFLRSRKLEFTSFFIKYYRNCHVLLDNL